MAFSCAVEISPALPDIEDTGKRAAIPAGCDHREEATNDRSLLLVRKAVPG
jgi:hypothetical protein